MNLDLLTLEQAKRELRILIGEPESSDGDPELDAYLPALRNVA